MALRNLLAVWSPPERSGGPEDFKNYVNWLRNIKDAFGNDSCLGYVLYEY